MTTLRPILFNTEMVRALLEGRKTQTRRLIKPQPSEEWMQNVFKLCPSGSMYDRKGIQQFWLSDSKAPDSIDSEIYNRYGKPGDILWVRESWNVEQEVQPPGDWDKLIYFYKATETKYTDMKWRPSIHMPKKACRLFLKIKDIRVERVKEIIEEDAIAEGVELIYPDDNLWKNYLTGTPLKNTAVQSYFSLWHSINKTDPVYLPKGWVWVIEFEKTDQPENFI